MSAKKLSLLSQSGTGTTARASSVLQRNVKLYGPKNALDCENGSTCWNSDGTAAGGSKSSPTISFVVDFGRLVQPHELRLQFQAGFAAEQIHIYQSSGRQGGDCSNATNMSGERNESSSSSSSSWKFLIELEAEDDHEIQVFPLQEEISSSSSSSSSLPMCQSLKLVFEECTDFYGRVTIYQLQVWGYEVESSSSNNDNNNTTSETLSGATTSYA